MERSGKTTPLLGRARPQPLFHPPWSSGGISFLTWSKVDFSPGGILGLDETLIHNFNVKTFFRQFISPVYFIFSPSFSDSFWFATSQTAAESLNSLKIWPLFLSRPEFLPENYSQGLIHYHLNFSQTSLLLWKKKNSNFRQPLLTGLALAAMFLHIKQRMMNQKLITLALSLVDEIHIHVFQNKRVSC